MDLTEALEDWTIDGVCDPTMDGKVELYFMKYQRCVAFMEVFQRYVPSNRKVTLVYSNGAGYLYVDRDVVEGFCELNPRLIEKKVV